MKRFFLLYMQVCISIMVLASCAAKEARPVSSVSAVASSQAPALSGDEVTGRAALLPVLKPTAPAGLDTAPQNWWFGQQADEKNRPLQCVQMQSELANTGLTALGPKEDTVYLTFDFGYETGYSEPILNILKEKQASATFFIVQSFAVQEKATLARMVEEGHSVGSHSITHPGAPNGVAGLSVAQQMQEIGALADILQEEYEYSSYLFRFPEGIFSEQALGTAANLGYYSVFWSYGYNDWSRDSQPNPSESLQKALEAAHPGAIYLLHPQSTNTEILGSLIDGLREKGYKVEGL